MTGTIKALHPTFGFITADGKDWFFHDDDLVGLDIELIVGDEVNFEPVLPEPAKGPRAREVAWRARKSESPA